MSSVLTGDLALTEPAAEPLPAGHPQVAVPPGDRLLDGMRMDIDEFRRRYEVVEQITGIDLRAELVFGVVHMWSPPDLNFHAAPLGDLHSLLGVYRSRTAGVLYFGDGGLERKRHSLIAPDAMLLIEPERGGQMTRRDDGGYAGFPELCIEVANTSERYDTTTKRVLYDEAGVREYVVHLVRQRRFVAFTRDDVGLVAHPIEQGVFASGVFPGLRIDCDALLRNDFPAALTTLEAGLATPEHAAFVRTLEARHAD